MPFRLLLLCLFLSRMTVAQEEPESASLRYTCWELFSIQKSSKDKARLIPYHDKPYLYIRDSLFYGHSTFRAFVGRCYTYADSVYFDWPYARDIGSRRLSWIEDGLIRQLMYSQAKYVIGGDTLTLYGDRGVVCKFSKKGYEKDCWCIYAEKKL